MTIASEIGRLQTAKSCIKAAIEDKGVSVGSDLTLDDYADCIAAIQTGGLSVFCYLMVGGGGGGGRFGGGGGGEVLCDIFYTKDKCINVGVGCYGQGGYLRYVGYYAGSNGCPGGNSYIGSVIAHGGCGACYSSYCCGANSGSGCTGGNGVNSTGCLAGGGGGGASGNGCSSSNVYCGGNGGAGLYGYGGGGGGAGHTSTTTSIDGGGMGGITCSRCSFDLCCMHAKNCGGGGGALSDRCQSGYAGNGGGGIVKICYLSDGSQGITCATGGTKSTSGNYTVHTFTSNGTFCIVC